MAKVFCARPDGWPHPLKRIAAALLAALAAPRTAAACAACGCGDPTLAAVGAEKPFDGRLRLSVDARYRTDAVGVKGVDRLELGELRSDLQVAWSPTAAWALLATLPVGYRRIDYVNGSSQNTSFVGDPELRAKAYVWQDRRFDPRHLLGVVAGLTLPLGTALSESTGRVPLELGVSLGVPTALVGLSYAGFARPWSMYASATLSSAFYTAKDGDKPSTSGRATLAVQHQTTPSLALRASAHLRVDQVATSEFKDDPNSGGWVAFAGPEVLFALGGDATAFAYLRVPFASGLRGNHDEGPIVGLGLVWDR